MGPHRYMYFSGWLVRNVCLVEPCSSSDLAEVDVEHTSERHFQQLIIQFFLHIMYFYTHEAAIFQVIIIPCTCYTVVYPLAGAVTVVVPATPELTYENDMWSFHVNILMSTWLYCLVWSFYSTCTCT